MQQQREAGGRLQPGDYAPNCELRGPDGASLTLASLWQGTPLVLSFLRHFG